MNPAEVLEKVREVVTVRATIGEPIHEDGMVIVPAAKIRGGIGGGQGREGTGKDGKGAGFGVSSTPVGVFVIKDGSVSWRPAVDVNKIIVGGQVVAIVALLTVRAIVKARFRR